MLFYRIGLGIGFGERVAILAANSHAYVEVYAGVPAAGRVVVPLNTRHAERELEYALKDSGARVLITDRDHAVPVQINRNGIRSIAGGTGRMDQLELENVTITADVVKGDLVETSGLGGRFPEGYPVGEVESVVVDPAASLSRVLVRPSALLDRSRHVLVVFAPETRDEVLP